MRKNKDWIVTAIAAVACGVLLWAWFALGFNHVDDPGPDLVVAVAWWLVVAAVAGGGGVVRARGQEAREDAPGLRRRGRRVRAPEAGLVMPGRTARAGAGSAGADALGHGVPRRGGRAGRARAPRLPLGGAEPQVRPQRRGLGGRGRRRPRPGRRGAAPVRVPRRATGRPPGGVGATRRPFGAET